MAAPITIAVSKGRILKELIPHFPEMGFDFQGLEEDNRRLVFNSLCGRVRLIIIRGADVITYVDYGAAGLGVVGKDYLMEYDSNSLYETLDLDLARCRLVVAACRPRPGKDGHSRRFGSRRLIATKYLNIARRHFADKGEQVEVIKLYGSMELAPVLGLAHAIVDLVDSGRTLADNGLEEREEIATISARLVANKALMKMRGDEMNAMVDVFKRLKRHAI